MFGFAFGEQAFGEVPLSFSNAVITGVSAQASAGTLASKIDVTVAGIAVTANAGAIGGGVDTGIAGADATTEAGTLVSEVDVSPSVSATATAGTLHGDVQAFFTGVFGTAAAGALLPQKGAILFGVEAQPGAGLITIEVTQGGTSIWRGPSRDKPAARIVRRMVPQENRLPPPLPPKGVVEPSKAILLAPKRYDNAELALRDAREAQEVLEIMTILSAIEDQ